MLQLPIEGALELPSDVWPPGLEVTLSNEAVDAWKAKLDHLLAVKAAAAAKHEKAIAAAMGAPTADDDAAEEKYAQIIIDEMYFTPASTTPSGRAATHALARSSR